MKTILFVEDDPVIVLVYQRELERSGFRVEVAVDGLAAMKVLLPLQPNLVVLDLLMPKVDGMYVLKFIRSRPELKATKVIVFSSASLADVAKGTLDLNPERVLLKSQCTPKLLTATVVALLRPNESAATAVSEIISLLPPD